MGVAEFDLFIIGGGINGCGIARDAAGRGFSVFLAEMDDLASGTSSASTKLIHGGLRYLEHYEFRLVRESLEEREVLWGMAPHIIWPLRFVLPYQKGLRPAWMLRLGLFIYDNLGTRKLIPPTKTRDMRSDPLGSVLKPGFGKAFEYSDCWADDARLVALNAVDAAARGAQIQTRTQVIGARREAGFWVVTIKDTETGAARDVTAKMLINAAGPWVGQVLAGSLDAGQVGKVRLVKGSHIVVPRLHEDERCFFFQNGDGRIIFAIPYEGEFTLIGTTDADFDGDPRDAAISDAEIDYLCSAASEYFVNPVRREHIVWSYAGVRSLYDDGASEAKNATRDYVLELKNEAGQAALLNVIGGKITTFRRLAESTLERVEAVLGKRKEKWTAGATLPGGDFAVTGYEEVVARLMGDYPFLSGKEAKRYVRRYGTRAWTMLGNAASLEDLGTDFGAGLYEAEVAYLVEHEWARSAEDVLWRRTKRGLYKDQIDIAALEAFISSQRPAR